MLVAGPIEVHGLLRIRPCAEEKGEQPMMKHVAESGKRGVAMVEDALASVFGEAEWQGPVRSEQAKMAAIDNRRPGGVLAPDGLDR